MRPNRSRVPCAMSSAFDALRASAIVAAAGLLAPGASEHAAPQAQAAPSAPAKQPPAPTGRPAPANAIPQRLVPEMGCPCGTHVPIPSAEPHFQESMRLTGAGEWSKALGEAELAAKMGPKNRNYLNQKAVALFNAGRPEDAFKVWNGLKEEKVEGCEMTFYLNALCRKAMWKEAVALAPLAIENCRTSADAHVLHAIALQALGRYSEALNESREATALDPQSGAAHYQESSVQSDMGNYDASSEAAGRALKIDGKDAAAMAAMAVAKSKQGKAEEAAKWAQDAAKATSDPAFLRMAGQVLAGTGKQREAIGAFDRSLAAGFDPATAYDRAAALESLGDRAAARQAFEDIESKAPGFKDVAARIAALKK